MLDISIKIALVAIAVSMALTLYRLIKGPDGLRTGDDHA